MRADELLRALGAEIRQRRETLALSQEELAYRAGVSRNMLSALELGDYNPSFRKLLAVIVELELLPSALLGRAERRSSFGK